MDPIIVKIYGNDGTIQELKCEKETLEGTVHSIDLFACGRIEIGDARPKPCISFKDLPAALEAAFIAEDSQGGSGVKSTKELVKNLAKRIEDFASGVAAAKPKVFILEEKTTGETKEITENRVRYLCEPYYRDLDEAVEDLIAGAKLQTTFSYLYYKQREDDK